MNMNIGIRCIYFLQISQRFDKLSMLIRYSNNFFFFFPFNSSRFRENLFYEIPSSFQLVIFLYVKNSIISSEITLKFFFEMRI